MLRTTRHGKDFWGYKEKSVVRCKDVKGWKGAWNVWWKLKGIQYVKEASQQKKKTWDCVENWEKKLPRTFSRHKWANGSFPFFPLWGFDAAAVRHINQTLQGRRRSLLYAESWRKVRRDERRKTKDKTFLLAMEMEQIFHLILPSFLVSFFPLTFLFSAPFKKHFRKGQTSWISYSAPFFRLIERYAVKLPWCLFLEVFRLLESFFLRSLWHGKESAQSTWLEALNFHWTYSLRSLSLTLMSPVTPFNKFQFISLWCLSALRLLTTKFSQAERKQQRQWWGRDDRM